MASKALKQHRSHHTEEPRFTNSSRETRMRGYVPIYRHATKTDARLDRANVKSFLGEGNMPYNSFSLVSSPLQSDFPTRTNSFRKISPSKEEHFRYHKKRTAPLPPPNRYPSPDAGMGRRTKKRQAPKPPDQIRRRKESWSLDRAYAKPPREPPVDYDLYDDESSSKSGSDPSPVSSPPPGFSDIARGQPPTPPPLPTMVCDLVNPPAPPPLPTAQAPNAPPLPPMQPVLQPRNDGREGIDPALKAQILENAKKRMENGPIVIEKQEQFHEKFARELKKAFEMRQKRLLKGTIKMKYQQKNTIIYKATEDKPPTPKVQRKKPPVPEKKAHLSSSDVLLSSVSKVEKEAEAEARKKKHSSDSSVPKKISWTPDQDLNGEVFSEGSDHEEERTQTKAGFYEMLYGKTKAPDVAKNSKKDSSSSQESDHKGSLRRLKKSVKKSVKNVFGSLRPSPKSRKSIDVSIKNDTTWQIYPACMYDAAPEGPINIVRMEKGPAYAYHPARGQLVLLPDYDNIIVTDDGRKIREATMGKGVATPAEVLKLVERRISSQAPEALVVPTPLRDHKESIIEERHTQDVVEMQFQQVQELNKQFQDEALAASGLDTPVWDMIKHPKLRRRSDRTSWETVCGSVKMTAEGLLMYCDPKNDFNEKDEDIVQLNQSSPNDKKKKKKKSVGKYGRDYGEIVPVTKPMIKVLRKGWKAYKDNSDTWDLSNNNNPMYASDEEDEEPKQGLKSVKSEPVFKFTMQDDSGYEGGNSTENTPQDDDTVPPLSKPQFGNNSCPNSPTNKKHRRPNRQGTVLSPLACGYTISPDGSLTSSQHSLNSSPGPSLSTSLDTGLNSSGVRQNTVININVNRDQT